MNKLVRKAGVACGAICATVGSALAEGATEVDASLVTQYITSGRAQVVSVLTAGAAIVGAFFVWGLIKRALRSSK